MAVDDAAQATAREDLCRYLAACYYEPGPAFSEERLFDSMREAAGRTHPDLEPPARRLGDAFAAESAEALLVEYTRTFLGPIDPVARPYGSVWLGRSAPLMQDSTMALLNLYEEGGFEIAEDFRELPDHIAAELEFLYLLIFRENQARRAGDAKALGAAAATRRRLLDEHLDAWVGDFARAVKDGTRSAFYRELADLTERFVRMEAQRASPP